MGALLEIDDLHVVYDGPEGDVRAVDGLSLAIEAGTTYALVGESGCGKTAASLAILRLVEPGRITAGQVRFDGADLVAMPERDLRGLRGNRVGVVFQEAAAALNPVMRVGTQVGEAIRTHRRLDRRSVRAEVERLLAMVRLPDPARVARAYPHELSGGMKQRVMMAIALSCGPDLLIADEPTTALDVTIQAQILELLRDLRAELGLTVLLVTHDLGVVAENADRVGVMYAGRLVEEAPVATLFREPAHPYTRALLRAVPSGRDDGNGAALPTVPGAVPDPARMPTGCRFHPRCPDRVERCDRDDPRIVPIGPGHRVACHLHAAVAGEEDR